MPRRVRLASQVESTYSRLPPRTPSGGRIPTLVVMTTSSRREPSARPRNSSDFPPPYPSAVSKWLIPASKAASTTAWVASASSFMPKLLQPMPATVTSSEPTLRVSITVIATFPFGASRYPAPPRRLPGVAR